MTATTIIWALLQDGFFAALAAVGFSAISNPPRIALGYCALIAAIGHMTRFSLMNYAGINIVFASLAGAVTVGLLAVLIAPRVKCPPETFAYPSLLPMIPGIYAYRTLQAFFMALSTQGESDFSHYFYLFEFNGLTCLFVILCMVVGQMIPIMIFKHITYTATRG